MTDDWAGAGWAEVEKNSAWAAEAQEVEFKLEEQVIADATRVTLRSRDDLARCPLTERCPIY